jgi:two-component system NtrC family sensor kinase
MPVRGLAARLILSLSAVFIVVEALSTVLTLRREENQIVRNMVTGADQLSRGITSATWHAMLADRRSDVYEILQNIAAKQGVDSIRMYNKDGALTFTTGAEPTTVVDARAAECMACHAGGQPLLQLDLPARSRIMKGADGRRRLGMVTPIYNEAACSQAACHAHPGGRSVLGVLDVTLDLSSVDEELAALKRRGVLVVATEAVVLSAFVVLFIRRFVHKPIRRLMAATRAVSAMQLDRPIVIDAHDEVADLAQSFDVMRVRLRDAMAELNDFTRDLESKVRERTEQLRLAQQKLVQSDRLASLGQLAASVAHEINNPLSGVLNLSMLMQRVLQEDGIPLERVPEFRQYLAQVSHETARVGRIVSDLLAFSRRAKPHRGPADLNAIIRTTANLVEHKLDLLHVEARLELQDNLPKVTCDASQMQQVMMNLLMNGAESIQGAGTVTVRTRVAAGGQSALLEVSDTGSGIAPENLPRIFDPFFTTKEEGKGVGLGLSVVYGIIQAHDGEIDVESRVGAGTTFRVSLPLAATDAIPGGLPHAAAG